MRDPELLASELGWPEGPTAAPDGAIVFVESYRSRLSAVRAPGEVEPLAFVAGAPNSCVHGAAGELYICQNGGTVGPWRAAEMTVPSIQRLDPEGSVEILLTDVAGVPLNGPNDLVFGPDGHLYFTDPGTFAPDSPDPSYIYAIDPDGNARLVLGFDEPVFPNGIVVEADGSVVWDESYSGHVGRLRPDGVREDLGRLPGESPLPDGMTIAADGRLLITDMRAGGIHVLHADGSVEGFIACGAAPTNCVFGGSDLYVTDAGVIADSAEPSLEGTLWRIAGVPPGPPALRGSIS